MAEKISVSLQNEHIRAVERFGKRTGIKSFSGALQVLIHQFDQQQKAAEAGGQQQAEQPKTPVAA